MSDGYFDRGRDYGDRGRDRDYDDQGRDYGDRGRDYDRGGEDERGGRSSRGFRRRKTCRFCGDQEAKIDYRDAGMIKYYISERGKIVPRRISGNCAKHQRELAVAVKRARAIALIPFTITGA